MRAIACLGLLVLSLPLSGADTKFDPASRSRALAPLIDEETIALVRIDFTRIDLDGLAKTLQALLPSRKGELMSLAGPVKAFQTAFTKARGTELVVSLSTEDLPAISILHVPLNEGADIPALTALLKQYLPAGAAIRKQDSALVAGPREALERLARATPSARAELPAAVKAAGDTAVQVLLLPTADHRRVIDEVVMIPGSPGKVLTRGVRWAALGLDIGAKPRAVLTLQSADATAAKKLAGLIAARVDLVGEMKFMGEDKVLKELLPKEFAVAAKALKPQVTGNQVTLQVSGIDAVRAFAVLADTSDELVNGFKRSTTHQQFRQMGNGLHEYHDAHGTFPPHAIYGKAGKPLLSWRVAMLPYLGEAKLFKEFRLDEAWDSPHNKKLIDRMPAVYRSPKIKDRRPGLTTYLAPINKEFFFTGTKEGVPMKDILDGTSNTAFVVDVNDETGVLWTKPDDLVVSKKDPWKGLLGHYRGFILVGTADGGGAMRVARTVKPYTLWALFTRSGGEVLPDLSK